MQPSTPPPPFDDQTVDDPLKCPPLRWGLIGCGRVSHDFTQALKNLPTATVSACSARDVERAKEFATKHGIKKFYGDYDELLQDEEVDIVYVGNLHVFRRTIGEKCLRANKHVLLEKPFACTPEDAQFLVDLAKEKNLFLMEGMWTRFFPAVELARRLVYGADGKPGVLGEVVSVLSDFNFNASDSDEYPTSFFYNRKLGGGASMLVAPYPFAASTLFFGGGVKPDSIKAVGQVDEPTGVDLQAAVVMSFPPTPGGIAPALDDNNPTENTAKLPGSGIAICNYGFLGESEEQTLVIGTKGRMTIESPAHCPTRVRVRIKASGRGNVGAEDVYEFPLPEETEEIKKAGGYVYPNSAGFMYEAAAVARCIAAGKTEAPQFTLQETLINVSLMSESLKQLGVKPIFED